MIEFIFNWRPTYRISLSSPNNMKREIIPKYVNGFVLAVPKRLLFSHGVLTNRELIEMRNFQNQ
jgi:hypothetical protein